MAERGQYFHNVFSKSDANRFDLDLYKKGDPAKKSPPFDKPGEVDVFCSIHARMSCIILVLENPYFAKTDGRGRYTITNVPPGHYTLVAWQERLPNDTKEIIVPETGKPLRCRFYARHQESAQDTNPAWRSLGTNQS